MSKPSILAPAGNTQQLYAAINAGCDAVYLGGKKFGARAYAGNFSDDELVQVIAFAHERDVEVYVTINTIVYEDECSSFFDYTDFLVQNHVDALIVQDFGMLHELLLRYPNTAIHASTQMNVLNLDQAKYLQKIGVKRIIFGREASLEDVVKVKETTGLEVEVFVHGALCVSYSGNCYLSVTNGVRSGNRGECAQPCRLPYQLIKNGEVTKTTSHILSTKELMTLDHIEEIVKSGVDCVKIEGRMRSPEYTVEVVKAYRQALDAALQDASFDFADSKVRISKVYNRDFTKGYLFHERPFSLTRIESSNHQGVLIGKVLSFNRGKTTILLRDDLSVGDGIRILGTKEVGDRVSRIMSCGSLVDKAQKGDTVVIDLREEVSPNDLVVKTQDQDIINESVTFLVENYPLIPVNVVVNAFVGRPLSISFDDGKNTGTFVSDYVVQKAQNQGATKDQILKQVDRLKDTPYYIHEIQIHLEGEVFLPNQVLNETRRRALQSLKESRLYREDAIIVKFQQTSKILGNQSHPSTFVVKVETIDQLKAAMEFPIDEIWVDSAFQDKSTVSKDFGIILPRIKPANWQIPQASSFLIQDLGDLMIPNVRKVSDVYFNTTNSYSMRHLFEHGVSTCYISLECNKTQIADAVMGYIQRYGENPDLGMIIYGHYDSMITKYCPIVKGENVDVDHCQRCAMNFYELEDQMKHRYPLKNDGDCNIRILSPKRLNLLPFVDEIIAIGVQSLRMDFTIESYEETKELLKRYFTRSKRTESIPNTSVGIYGRV